MNTGPWQAHPEHRTAAPVASRAGARARSRPLTDSQTPGVAFFRHQQGSEVQYRTLHCARDERIPELIDSRAQAGSCGGELISGH